jgi:hypothetical protein
MRSIIASTLAGIVTSGGFLVLAAAVEFTLVNGSRMPVDAPGNDFAHFKPATSNAASSESQAASALSILPAASASEVSLTPPVAARTAGSHTLASDSASSSSN